MKIVLRQDVPKLGEAGTIHTVANGYARNYLIPQGMAILATPGEVKVAEHNLGVKARKVAKQEEQLQSLADRIDGQRLSFTARAGEQGRLFGSITTGDIATELAKAVGDDIDRRKILLDDPLRTVGEHAIVIHLVGRLRPTVTVVVAGELEDGTLVTSMEPEKKDAVVTPEVGHPVPGSYHDDSDLTTVEEGPEVPMVDGVPGAFGEPDTVGGPVTQTLMEGEGAEVTLNTDDLVPADE